jgi:hypothetical protein
MVEPVYPDLSSPFGTDARIFLYLIRDLTTLFCFSVVGDVLVDKEAFLVTL